jgi:hypothetical protein
VSGMRACSSSSRALLLGGEGVRDTGETAGALVGGVDDAAASKSC